MLPDRAQSHSGALLRIVYALLVVALTLLPVANIARIVATTGADVPSSDDYVFMVQFLAPALDGTFHWPDFFRATFYNTHAMYLPNLLSLANARLTASNLYALLYLGLARAAGRIPLLWFARAPRCRVPSSGRSWRPSPARRRRSASSNTASPPSGRTSRPRCSSSARGA